MLSENGQNRQKMEIFISFEILFWYHCVCMTKTNGKISSPHQHLILCFFNNPKLPISLLIQLQSL